MVLGDRWELVPVVMPAVSAGVRVVHLHGGEVTEGAIDERIRHAVTKLADQHCVASEESRPTGAPAGRGARAGARDRRARPGPAARPGAGGRRELAECVGAPVTRPLALFTYHPPTAEPGPRWLAGRAEALIATAAACGTVIATYPGLDQGREEVLAALLEVARHASDVVVVPALGKRYPRTLRSVDVVVGNSSSGIIEAASAGVPGRGRRPPPAAAASAGTTWCTADEGREAVAAGLGRRAQPELTDSQPHGRQPLW